MRYVFNGSDGRGELLQPPVSVWDATGKLIHKGATFFDTETGEVEQLERDADGPLALDVNLGLMRVTTFYPAPLTFQQGVYDECDRPTIVEEACR